VSKRVRGPVRTHRRPGARPAPERSATARRRPETTSQLVAAEVIAEDVVEERPVEAAAELQRISNTVPARTRSRPGSLLAARAATEYIYVAQDLRRIVVVAAALFGTMIVLWLLIVVFKVIPLPFY
jgi:hypothetical protein